MMPRATLEAKQAELLARLEKSERLAIERSPDKTRPWILNHPWKVVGPLEPIPTHFSNYRCAQRTVVFLGPGHSVVLDGKVMSEFEECCKDTAWRIA